LASAGASVTFWRHGPIENADEIVEPLEDSEAGVVLLEAESESPQAATGVVESCVARLGGLDIVIIAPQPFSPMPFLEQTEDQWKKAIEANVANALYISQAAARHMVAQGEGGRVIFISAVASEMAFHETSLMGTTLAAVNTLAQVAAIELGQHGITVNAVAPGWLGLGDTSSEPAPSDSDTLYFAGPFEEMGVDAVRYVTKGIPLGRLGKLEEVAGVCLFLASDAAGYVTGTYIKVDGGYAITKEPGGTPYPGREAWPTFDAGYDPLTADF